MGTIFLLVLVGGAIYFFATARNRRDDAVENRVKRMIAAGRDFATFNELYFDAARSYAIAKGAQAPERDAASTTMIVGGRSYFVVFMRENGNGTAISVRHSASVEREILSSKPRD